MCTFLFLDVSLIHIYVPHIHIHTQAHTPPIITSTQDENFHHLQLEPFSGKPWRTSQVRACVCVCMYVGGIDMEGGNVTPTCIFILIHTHTHTHTCRHWRRSLSCLRRLGSARCTK
jgi:hypothetical protein